MKFSTSLALALPALTSAFPASDMFAKVQDEEKRGLLSSLPTTLTNTAGILTGLLGSVATSVDPANKRPEPGYEFQAPGPNDSRGPCPALNLLANYGYLPRNGHVTFGQVLEATARGFNMGADLATVLAVFATLADGDIATESWYLGTNPNVGTHVGGLNRHSTVEADASPNKEDFYNGCGDNHHISSARFKQNVNIVKSSASKQFDYAAMRQQYYMNSKFSQANNPYFYYFPFPSIVSVVAYNFYPEFFSNGSYGLGGVANYESISKIVGANMTADGNFEYVPERWPESGWYRRSTPYEAVQALADGFTRIYPVNPVPMLISQLATPKNLNLDTILCDIYQGINSITPIPLTGGLASASEAIAWAGAKLDLLAPGTIAGCPKNAVSNNFYPNKKGGPQQTPPSVLANTGNNVYNKVYFKTGLPTTPQCNHVSDPVLS